MHFENDGSGLGVRYRNAEAIDVKAVDALVREVIPGSNPTVETLRMSFEDSFVQFQVTD